MRITHLLTAPAAFICLVASLSACQANNVSRQGTLDPHERTMTVPPGSSLLLGPIKEGLTKEGWKLVVDHGPDVLVGSVGEKTDLASSNTYLTRYRLLISQTQTDVCLPGGKPEVKYDLSVIDNQNGEEVLTESGKSCLGTGKAVGNLMAALKAR
jgi:hypothetical protein